MPLDFRHLFGLICYINGSINVPYESYRWFIQKLLFFVFACGFYLLCCVFNIHDVTRWHDFLWKFGWFEPVFQFFVNLFIVQQLTFAVNYVCVESDVHWTRTWLCCLYLSFELTGSMLRTDRKTVKADINFDTQKNWSYRKCIPKTKRWLNYIQGKKTTRKYFEWVFLIQYFLIQNYFTTFETFYKCWIPDLFARLVIHLTVIMEYLLHIFCTEYFHNFIISRF